MWGELVFNVDATFIEFDYWLDCISDITVPRRLHLPRHILCIIPLTPFFVRNHICVFFGWTQPDYGGSRVRRRRGYLVIRSTLCVPFRPG